jgi:hypothetical protein
MSAVNVVIAIILFINILAFFVNYGMVYAVLQRRDLQVARKMMWNHIMFATLYAATGLCGFYAITNVLSPRYGFKIFPIEVWWLSRKWKIKELESTNAHSETTGVCRSIW